MELRLLFSFLFLSGPLLAVERLPLRIFHGLYDSCAELKKNKAWAGRGRCVESGDGRDTVTSTLSTQALDACKWLVYEEDLLRHGFYILAYNNGGMVVKALAYKCPEILKYVRRIVFVRTPHLGIERIPNDMDFLQKGYKLTSDEAKKLKAEIKEAALKLPEDQRKAYIKEEEDKLKPREIGFFESVGNGWDSFTNAIGKQTDTFSVGLNSYLLTKRNTNDVITDFTENFVNWYSKLDLLVNIVSTDERIMAPTSSSAFGLKVADESNKLLEETTSDFLKAHPQTFGALWNSGKMINCLTIPTDIVKTYKTKVSAMMPQDAELAAIFQLFEDDEAASTHSESTISQLEKFYHSYPSGCQAFVVPTKHDPPKGTLTDLNPTLNQANVKEHELDEFQPENENHLESEQRLYQNELDEKHKILLD